MNKIVIIAQQIAQGMGYLHHRGIIHKDLKTKNIFLENGRAIITDFGLVNVARRLCANTRFGQEPASFSSLTERYVFKSFKNNWLFFTHFG
jgi:serine/threonine protein kinase